MQTVRQGRLGVDAVLADRYEVICRLARGGMGTVYLARQMGIDRRVAIKVLHPEKRGDPELVDLFKREAVAIKHLTHPNTVRLYDFGETESGYFYLVLEYLQGDCLDVVLEQRGPLPNRLLVHIGTQVLKSLIEAHARGIVHRDIKPSNLMLCRQVGEPDFVKLLDFGIAWHRLRGAPDSPDKPGEVMGTPRYMSPEQLLGDEVDPRSDLYSLGLTLYELASGRPVFASNQIDQVLAQRSRELRVALPEELRGTRLGRVVARALENKPGDRFPAAGDMLEALIAAPLPIALVDSPIAPASSAHLRPLGIDTPVGGVHALDATVPRVPGRPVTVSGEQPEDVAAPPRHHCGLPDEVVALNHPLSELVRARFEQRLRRRTMLTALITTLITLALGLALLQMG